MCKHFNTTGLCFPDEHYMVNIDGRLEEIKGMVDCGEYFAVNRARQYGKTTTLNRLAEKLSGEYIVFLISFEGIEDAVYENAASFCQRFCRLLYRFLRYNERMTDGISESLKEELRRVQSDNAVNLEDLSDLISELCGQSEKPVVIMIDEVDQAGNQKIFLSFLGMLRRKFLSRKTEPTFHSVVLAGVYDINNLKLKVRPMEEHQYNSPWNIAAEFLVDMNFSIQDIAGMLTDYEHDHHTGMDIMKISGLIYDYTSGYPFLVSRLCQILDENLLGKEGFPDLAAVWTKDGVTKAVKKLLAESNTLFDDLVKKLNDFPELRQAVYAILFKGEKISYSAYNHVFHLGIMFGFIKEEHENIVIANRIFETQLYNLFISEELLDSAMYKSASMDKDRNMFIRDGRLDMEQVLVRFTETFTDIYSDAEERFIEENGRRFFLLYLKPIINGAGNYYIEAQTRNRRRTDVIIDYCGEQFVCELKIWHGEEYNRRGEDQLLRYLEDYHLTTGYMLSFNFNKKKKTGVRKIRIGERTIIEAVV